MTETIDGTTYDILYDVLVKQTGEPHSDWTGVPLDVEAYRHVKFEPYDLKVLRRPHRITPSLHRNAAPNGTSVRGSVPIKVLFTY